MMCVGNLTCVVKLSHLVQVLQQPRVIDNGGEGLEGVCCLLEPFGFPHFLSGEPVMEAFPVLPCVYILYVEQHREPSALQILQVQYVLNHM